MTRRIFVSLLLTWLAARSAGAAVAVDDFFLSVENQEIEIPYSALLANDDLDSRTRWEVVLDSGPAWGDLTTATDGFAYKPPAGASGVDTFTYYLRGGSTPSKTATVRLHISPLWAPIAGDWDGDGDLEVGVFKNAPAPYFRLCESLAEQPVCPIYQPLPSSFAGFLPIAGNWGGDPADEVGLYNPETGHFYLFDIGPEHTLLALTNFQLGEGGKGDLPLAGDWNGDGTDTVGLRIAATGEFALRDASSTGGYDHVFAVAGSQLGWLPFAGDWLRDGTSGVGLFDPLDSRLVLRDDLTPGPAQWELEVGGSAEESALVPVLGIGDPAGLPELFSFFLFTRSTSSLIFYNYSAGGMIEPHLKVVIPTDPDGQTVQ